MVEEDRATDRHLAVVRDLIALHMVEEGLLMISASTRL